MKVAGRLTLLVVATFSIIRCGQNPSTSHSLSRSKGHVELDSNTLRGEERARDNRQFGGNEVSHETGGNEGENETEGGDSASRVVTLGEGPFFTNDTLFAGTSGFGDGNGTFLQFRWYVNGVTLPGVSDSFLPGMYFSRGDEVYVEVSRTNGQEFHAWIRSNTVNIVNAPPAIESVTIANGDARGVTLLVQVVTSDSDGDPVTAQWTINGSNPTMGEQVFLGPVMDGPNDIIVSVTDGSDSVTQHHVFLASVAPDTVLTEAPFSPTGDTFATFRFSSPFTSATFECRLDGGSWDVCISPHVDSVSTGGFHTFSVRAVDEEGRYDASPASVSWEVFSSRQMLSVGSVHSCVILDDGVLACWGDNHYGEAGLGVVSQPLTQPTIVTLGPASQRWLAVSAGNDWLGEVDNSCGIAMDHSMWCWGLVRLQMLVDRPQSTLAPMRVGTDEDWYDVRVANEFACALKLNRSLYCWGEGGNYPDARNTDSSNTLHSSPFLVAGGISWSMFDVGEDDVCGISIRGSLFCWGNDMPSGMSVQTPTLVNGDKDWASVSVARDHACALKTDHSLWCWGANEHLALGLPGGDRAIPNQLPGNDWLLVSAAITSTCALKLDHTIWCWGSEVDGNFGDGIQEYMHYDPILVSFDDDWMELVLRNDSACAMKFDRSIYCWGANFTHNLGAGLVDESATFRRINVPKFSSLTDLSDTRCGVGLDGELYCAGFNSAGQAGLPVEDYAPPTFTRILDGHDWLSVGSSRLGVHFASNDTCGLDSERHLYCWGWEEYGEYGHGVQASLGYTPVLAGGGKQWSSFSLGADFACAIDTASVMWCWGLNSFDQSAGASARTIAVLLPNQMPGVGWSKVQAFGRTACGLQAAALYCWGRSLTLGSDWGTMTPMPISPGRTWLDFSMSPTTWCAIDASGMLWCWAFGVSSDPVAISLDTDWARVYAGNNHACALKTNGTLWCFGGVSLEVGMPTDGTLWQIGTDTDWAGYYPGNGEYCALKFNGEMWCSGSQSLGQWGDGGFIAYTPQRVLEAQSF